MIGLAFPGVPGIQHFGHTGHAAWGVTNAVAHSDQVFRERLAHSEHGLAAAGPLGDEPVDVLETRLAVRGDDHEAIRCVETGRGTVVVDGDLCYSIRQPARVLCDLGFSAFRPLLRARSAEDVFSALKRWVDPVNRVLAADTGGRVLRGTVGVTPKLDRERRWLPQEPSEPQGWRDPSPPASVQGWAVDANELPADRPDHDLGDSYPSAARADRIHVLLGRLTGMIPEDFWHIHADTRSAPAVDLVDRLRRIRSGASLGPSARTLAEELEAWDGHMDQESRAAGRFAAWRSSLVRRLVGHPALAPLGSPHGMGGIFDAWFDVPHRIAASLESLLDADELGIDAATEMLGALEAAAGETVDRWGDRHALAPLHVLTDIAPMAASQIPSVGLPGDTDTVAANASVPGVTDLAFGGPVARWIWDLGDRDRSRWSVPFGASGVPTSPHFADQLDTWRTACTTQVVTDWSRLRETPWPASTPPVHRPMTAPSSDGRDQGDGRSDTTLEGR